MLSEELTVDELAAKVGVSVRTIRFYAGKKLLPPPRLEGRTGYYGPIHVARLEVIRDLQQAGYTLSAVEDFLADVPMDAEADQVELVGALLTPWAPQERITLTHAEASERLGTEVTDKLLELGQASGLVEIVDDGHVALTESQLHFLQRLLDHDAPFDALIEAGDAIRGHAESLAADLQRIFRERITERFGKATEQDRERLRALNSGLTPLTIQAIVASVQEALDREMRPAST